MYKIWVNDTKIKQIEKVLENTEKNFDELCICIAPKTG